MPQRGARFAFPRDHGSHPEFALEWWYVTGHLFETNGARYGFQATFFRRAGPRTSATKSPATPTFGDQELYLAHMALLDVQTGRFHHQERLNREGWDAGSSTETLSVSNGNWSLRLAQPPASHSSPLPAPSNRPPDLILLRGSIRAEASFKLQLVPQKPLVVFGADSVSRKAAEPTAASHYLTFTRLRVTGTLILDGKTRPVTGQAWMDHEFSSSQLGKGQVGWDWACLQLNDGREIMAYRMRRAEGSTDLFSTLAWVDQRGEVHHSTPAEFRWEPEGEWKSPATGGKYPARIRLTTHDPDSGQNVTFRIEPLAADQELTGALGGIPYWEGACRVLDDRGKVIGQAFLELTGYAGGLQGRL
ncbi:MAG TPA: lipocalin-like domain-containing protein [Verrucomicrobiota bacterium]|nr:lipocalin-like domain-containing protein [Verrucomicrobiota bacterium]